MSPGQARRRRGRGAALLAPLVAAISIGAVLIANAGAAPGCPSSQRMSADGTVAFGSACADTIVVDSPRVEKVFAGGGDDLIYANSEVEEIHGGGGRDVLYGELPEPEAEPEASLETEGEAGAGPEEGQGVDYQPAAEGDGADDGGAAASSAARAGRGPVASASNSVECTTAEACYGGDGSQEMFGGAGPDVIFGQRGNDTLHGEGGNDALYGGIGDDVGFGGEGVDLLSGGLGTDTLDGNNGSDIVRGDGTVDVLRDSGGPAQDTLSFATATPPGFRGAVPTAGFPAEGDGSERGVYLRADGAPAPCGTQSCNNDARYGGGGDEIEISGFESVIGSPFADYYVGSDGNDSFFGGGGTDVMLGNGGNDGFHGGADGDFMRGDGGLDTAFSQGGTNNCSADVENRNQCAGTADEVIPRDRSKITVGHMTTTLLRGGHLWEPFYMVGSTTTDKVNAKYTSGDPNDHLIFTTEAGSAEFDTSGDAQTGPCEYSAAHVKCRLDRPLDAVTIAGMAGDDRLSISTEGTKWPTTVTPILLGGQGNDLLLGSGQTEDTLVDGEGPGNDRLRAFGFDDALLNNEGSDRLQGGNGSDLLVSTTTCGGDILQGAEGRKGDGEAVNNASWSQLPSYLGGVVADLKKRKAGSRYTEPDYILKAKGLASKKKTKAEKQAKRKEKREQKREQRRNSRPSCDVGTPDRLRNIDDLEGSSQSDALYGDAHDNNLLGRKGEDLLFARGGDDRIAAQDGEADQLGGGGGEDLCIFDEGLDTVNRCDP